MSDYTLHYADCLDIFPTLVPQSVDAVICDPPYGTTACKWDSVIPFDAMWAGIRRVLKPRGACVLFGSQPFTSALVMSNVAWFKYTWVWDKMNKVTGFLDANNKPLKVSDDICIFSLGRHVYNPQKVKGKPYKATKGRTTEAYGAHKREPKSYDGWRYPQNILRIAADQRGKNGMIHPTQKPLALLEYLVKTYTNEGDTVLDFTMGSGTTGHACGNLGRRFVGIERDAAYFAIAEERIATAYAPLRHMQQAVA